jgi:hypothetical protein
MFAAHVDNLSPVGLDSWPKYYGFQPYRQGH